MASSRRAFDETPRLLYYRSAHLRTAGPRLADFAKLNQALTRRPARCAPPTRAIAHDAGERCWAAIKDVAPSKLPVTTTAPGPRQFGRRGLPTADAVGEIKPYEAK